MDRYQRVEKPRLETPISENEIRVTTQGKMHNYITYAISMLQDKGTPDIVLKAMGRAINKTVNVAEIIKRRVVGLHQDTSIGSTDITDTWEPLEEGLVALEQVRHVSMITIVLSVKELDTTSIGYQPPLPPKLVKPLEDFDDGGSPLGATGHRRGWGRGRGRGRGWRRGGYDGEYNGVDGSYSHGRGRGWGRGSQGSGFRGRGRGFGGGVVKTTQDGNGYEDANAGSVGDFATGRGRRGQMRGRVRGRGRVQGQWYQGGA